MSDFRAPAQAIRPGKRFSFRKVKSMDYRKSSAAVKKPAALALPRSRKSIRRAAYKKKKAIRKKNSPGFVSIFDPYRWMHVRSFRMGPSVPNWAKNPTLFIRIHTINKWNKKYPTVPMRRYFLTRLNYTSRFSMAQFVSVKRAFKAVKSAYLKYKRFVTKKYIYKVLYRNTKLLVRFLSIKKKSSKKIAKTVRTLTGERKKKSSFLLLNRHLTIGGILKKNKKSAQKLARHRVHGVTESERYFDTSFAKDFVDNKKRRFKLFRVDPATKITTDTRPKEFFFYTLKKDPIYDSFLLEKIISSFSKHGKKEKIRKVFYDIFLDTKAEFSIDTLYYVIDSLRPKYINVPVRAGPRYYYAPILASPFRSTLRAIRFFKMAVMSHKDKKSLHEKILFELENIFEF
eukprot:TRINITY_DN4342_c0_g1_i10.p1 TRINITY_DN4342_c0_g1~~TRINITY_DN4342_c0_g1_i10.p1  ORF type:complete len:463 (+),score=-28.29 TRINITY_DN4342_c0_g1_i10:192-1391(+)